MERTYYTLDDIRIEVGLYPTDNGPYAMQKTAFSTFLNTCLTVAGYDTCLLYTSPSPRN